MKKIDAERMHSTACALRTVILWLEKSRHHHPESGCGQMCDKWKKDADWLKRLARKISSANVRLSIPPLAEGLGCEDLLPRQGRGDKSEAGEPHVAPTEGRGNS